MFHHIYKHKHGIKQTIYAYFLILFVGIGLFFLFKSDINTKANPANTENTEKSQRYGTSFPDTEESGEGASPATKQEAKTRGNYKVQTKNLSSYLVKTVIDGDTFVIDGDKRIRLAGIKAPDKDEELGIESADYLRKVIGGKEVYIELDSENPKDSLGRFRAIVYIEQKNMNIEMIRNGFAHLFPVNPSVIDYDDWKVFEQEAQEAKKELWGDYKNSEDQVKDGEIQEIFDIKKLLEDFQKKQDQNKEKTEDIPSI